MAGYSIAGSGKQNEDKTQLKQKMDKRPRQLTRSHSQSRRCRYSILIRGLAEEGTQGRMVIVWGFYLLESFLFSSLRKIWDVFADSGTMKHRNVLLFVRFYHEQYMIFELLITLVLDI